MRPLRERIERREKSYYLGFNDIDEARAVKWRLSRAKNGLPANGPFLAEDEPMEEIVEEFLDALNYAEVAEKRHNLNLWLVKKALRFCFFTVQRQWRLME